MQAIAGVVAQKCYCMARVDGDVVDLKSRGRHMQGWWQTDDLRQIDCPGKTLAIVRTSDIQLWARLIPRHLRASGLYFLFVDLGELCFTTAASSSSSATFFFSNCLYNLPPLSLAPCHQISKPWRNYWEIPWYLHNINKVRDLVSCLVSYRSAWQKLVVLCSASCWYYAAEIALKQESRKPGYSILLLQIVAEESVPQSVRLSASLSFKNFIKFNWVVSGLDACYSMYPDIW